MQNLSELISLTEARRKRKTGISSDLGSGYRVSKAHSISQLCYAMLHAAAFQTSVVV